MSLITDALRKAQQQQPFNPQKPAGSTPSRAVWLIAAALLLVGTFVYWAWPKNTPRIRAPRSRTLNTTPPRASFSGPKPIPALTPVVGIPPLASVGWRVDGVITGGFGKPSAIINGELVEEGKEISGAKLVRVNSEEVELLHNGEPVRITVNQEN